MQSNIIVVLSHSIIKVQYIENIQSTFYNRKNPGVIDLYHEAFHAKQYLNIGQDNYLALGVLEREEYVYNRLMEVKQLFNEAELLNATKYINRLRDR